MLQQKVANTRTYRIVAVSVWHTVSKTGKKRMHIDNRDKIKLIEATFWIPETCYINHIEGPKSNSNSL